MKIFPNKSLSIVDKAIFIATQAHLGQKDKGGVIYILHPIAVMKKLMDDGIKDEALLAAAVLHDVVEDSDWTLEDIFHSTRESVVDHYVSYLTHHKEIPYMDYIAMMKKNCPAVIPVKLADIWHNTLPERLNNLKGELLDKRLEKYKKAKEMLLA